MIVDLYLIFHDIRFTLYVEMYQVFRVRTIICKYTLRDCSSTSNNVDYFYKNMLLEAGSLGSGRWPRAVSLCVR